MENSNEKKIIFRTALSGYKKEDVNQYIADENRRFMAIEATYNNTIDKLSRDLDSSKAEINKLLTKLELLDGISEKLSEAETKIAELNSALEESKKEADKAGIELLEKEDQVSSAKTALFQKEEELRASAEQLSAALGELSDAKAEIERLKSALDGRSEPRSNAGTSFKHDTDDLLSRARTAAEDILKRAEAGAEVILDRARKEALDYREEIFTAAKEVFSAATEELRRSIGICMSDFVSGIKNAKTDTARAGETSVHCEDDLSRRIERMQNDLDRAIAEKLAQFDKRK